MIEERLLNAVLHLFALQAAGLKDAARGVARQRVFAYLHESVGLVDVDIYIGIFDELSELHAATGETVILEQAARMTERLKTLLHGYERQAALLRFLELAANLPADERPRRIALLIGHTLGVPLSSLEEVLCFIADPLACTRLSNHCRRLGGGTDESFRAPLAALRLADAGFLLIAPVGAEPIYLEGRILHPGSCHPLRPGHVLRDQWGNELHYVQIVAAFTGAAPAAPRVVLSGERLEFCFPGSANGLHDLSFQERDGRLVAIMGGSGAGKSTLLSLLSGAISPASGQLWLNGRDVQAEPGVTRGVFGFVPQDDLLFEDLTVFDNLYYAARLCLAHLPEADIIRRVHGLLSELGQASIAGLKVGSPLDKSISGGQRKRLNIALELIREPTVLFVDEPTSGLSSADSELVMSLLKQQTAHGRLVFVVIHQPSSKIFRLFDALWVLDQGGWLIFSGSPLEAVAYFRSRGGWAGAQEAVCPVCGSLNPEQLFDIIEARLLDAAGNPTDERKTPPQTWSQWRREYEAERPAPRLPPAELPLPEPALHTPTSWGQLRLFFSRDLRARLANKTYLAIALLEPPLLGLVLSLLARGPVDAPYSFHDNHNLPTFLFMSVVVALFLGLSISAEEICRDARILQRERFLHLSWWSYIHSKVLYLALATGLQMALFLSVAIPLLEIPALFLQSWLILFACAFAASVLGLNISAALRSAVAIYILIPLLLVPQMLLSGVIITYDDLIPTWSSRREVPGYANLLPSRWGYEALVVEQYRNNPYMRHLVEVDARVRLAEDDLDSYLPELKSRVQSITLLRDQGVPADQQRARLRILARELARLEQQTGLAAGLGPADLDIQQFNPATAARLDHYLTTVRQTIFAQRRAAADERGAILVRLERELGRAELESLQKTFTNQAIQRQVLNLQELEPVGEGVEGLYRRTLPVYRMPESSWGGAHFLAGDKQLGNHRISTYWFNLAAILLLALLLYLALGMRLLPLALSGISAIQQRLGRRYWHRSS